MFWIKSPVWSESCIYVHTRNFNQVVGISYRDKYGNQMFPNTIKLTEQFCKPLETKTFKWGKAWKIPLEEFE